MARLDVYPRPGRPGEGYLVDIQADILSDLATRMVVPLLPEADVRGAARRLNPVFEIEGQRCVLMTHLAGAVPRRVLSGKVVSLKERHDAIVAAFDLLITGF